MTQRTMIEMMLERYGEDASVNGAQVRAILQPLQRRTDAGGRAGESVNDLYYRYTGPVGQKLQAGDRVAAAGRSYEVQRSDTFVVGGEEIYVRAVVTAVPEGADTQVSLESQGVEVATADSYLAAALQDSVTLAAWGESVPVGTAAGAVGYEIKLYHVLPLNDTDLNSLSDFCLIVKRPGSAVVYSGCRWKELSSAGGNGKQARQTMTLIASAREQKKEPANGG